MDLFEFMNNLTETVKIKEFEFAIPQLICNDIDEFVKGLNEKSLSIDCLADEIYGSINMCQSSKTITKEQADELRAYYYYGGIFDDYT